MSFEHLRTVILIVVAILILSTSAFASDIVKILMVGDSITQGGNKPKEFSYRYALFKLLIDKNICFDFIGSRSHAKTKGFIWPDYRGQKFDLDHEGYYGINTKKLLEMIKKKKSSIAFPDIVLLHVGTNDRRSLNLTYDVEVPLQRLILEFNDMNPNVIIFVSLLNQKFGEINEIRNSIIKVIADLNANTEIKVHAVDHHSNWFERPDKPDSDTIDWVHPNEKGQRNMATIWLNHMEVQYEFNRDCHGS